jgi:DNA-binding NtrC family response regulator
MTRVLVVDDEAGIRLLYSQELAEEGYEVDTAGTIDEAVDLLASNVYAVALLDIKLKNESGLDLLQKIVRERHEMVVILSTAFSCYKDDFSAWLADGYVVKSSDMQELKDEIKRLLEKKRAR